MPAIAVLEELKGLKNFYTMFNCRRLSYTADRLHALCSLRNVVGFSRRRGLWNS